MINERAMFTIDIDGGNPRSDDAIKRISESAFSVEPFNESGDPNYHFRLDLVGCNPSRSPVLIDLEIHWNEPKYQSFRDYVWHKGPGDSEWKYITGRVTSTSTLVSLTLDPGNTYISMHPKYTYSDYIRLLSATPQSDLIEKELIGITNEGRDIWCLNFRGRRRRSKNKMLCVSRIHPYETAGSYCAEGIIELFSKGDCDLTKTITDGYDLHLIPMANPDGVCNGYGKLTSPGGVDLSKTVKLEDSTSRTIKNAIDRIRPDIYFEIHNWMHKSTDGIYYMNFWQCRNFINMMQSRINTPNTWKPMLNFGLFAYPPKGFKRYCRERFRSIVACFEYPWFNRTAENMKQLGIETVVALSKKT